jgi:hypothetical protein
MSSGDGAEIVLRTNLAAFEIYLEAVDQGIGRLCAAEWSARSERGDHLHGFDPERTSSVAGGIAASEKYAADANLFDGVAGDLTEGLAEQRRVGWRNIRIDGASTGMDDDVLTRTEKVQDGSKLCGRQAGEEFARIKCDFDESIGGGPGDLFCRDR